MVVVIIFADKYVGITSETHTDTIVRLTIFAVPGIGKRALIARLRRRAETMITYAQRCLACHPGLYF